MFSGLSLDQAPPFEAPLLFFFTAPLFLIAAALQVWMGAGIFGVLHSFTLGFLAFVMVGALLQMLPVVVGVRFGAPKRVAFWVYAPLLFGTILIIAALGFGALSAGFGAALLLIASLGGFGIATFVKLLRAPRKSDSVTAMILSLLSLVAATLLGAHLLISLALGKVPSLAAAHGAFAAFGWVGLLIAGVSYQVIPMFYVTKEIPLKKWLAPALFGATLLYAFGIAPAFYAILALLFAFGALTLWRLAARSRAIYEPSIGFWYMGLISLMAAAIYGAASGDILFGLLYGYGFAASVVFGMLYKIIPFLAWFHISSRGFFDIPTMKELLSERLATYHLALHAAALILLPFAADFAALLIAAEALLFYLAIKRALLFYFEYRAKPAPFGDLKGR